MIFITKFDLPWRRFIHNMADGKKDVIIQRQQLYRRFFFGSSLVSVGILIGLSIGYKYHEYLNRKNLIKVLQNWYKNEIKGSGKDS